MRKTFVFLTATLLFANLASCQAKRGMPRSISVSSSLGEVTYETQMDKGNYLLSVLVKYSSHDYYLRPTHDEDYSVKANGHDVSYSRACKSLSEVEFVFETTKIFNKSLEIYINPQNAIKKFSEIEFDERFKGYQPFVMLDGGFEISVFDESTTFRIKKSNDLDQYTREFFIEDLAHIGNFAPNHFNKTEWNKLATGAEKDITFTWAQDNLDYDTSTIVVEAFL